MVTAAPLAEHVPNGEHSTNRFVLIQISRQPSEAGAVVIPTLQTRKLRLGEARTVTHAHGSRRPACGPARGSEGTGPARPPLREPPRGCPPTLSAHRRL